MSNFGYRSLEKVSLKFTTTRQFSTSNTAKQNIYLKIPSIHNNTTSDHFSNTKYELDVPSIENKWEDDAIKYGEEYQKIQHKKSTKQTLKQHV